MYDKCEEWKIPELKDELMKLGARLSGRKHVLVDRLKAYGRNGNFGKVDDVDPEYHMDLPDHSTYKDINSDMTVPPSSMAHIAEYLDQVDQVFDQLFVDLYNEQYIRYVRVSTSADCTYIRGECRAEQKKAVTYKTDIKIAKSGCIQEAQCECSVGQGPNAHCKHVCTVLHGIVQFNQKGLIRTEETCTAKLQTFHQCKKFSGSPIKAENLHLSNHNNITTNIHFDPRPPQFQNNPSYKAFFRNLVINGQSNMNTNMPLTQLTPPANTFAMEHDHDFLQLMPEEHFLHQLKVEGSITDDERSSIEERTREQNKSKEWQSERCLRLQSSNFGRICKATPKTDKRKLAQSLMEFRKIKAPALEHGHKFESEAVDKFSSLRKVTVKASGIVVSKEFPFIGSSPDGITEAASLKPSVHTRLETCKLHPRTYHIY